MLLGETGLLSFGHAVYYGLGGFMAVHAMNTVIHDRLPIPVPLMPLVGGLSGLLFGVIFGSVSTRRAGTAFAMISLGLGELVASSSLILRGFFGGEEGVSTNRTKLLRLFDLNFGPQIQVYYLIAGWCLLCMVAMYALTRTPFGRICNAVRENPERAQFVGYNPRIVRRHCRRVGRYQFRIGQFLRGQRGTVRSGAARRLHRGRKQFHRTGGRSNPCYLA
jgi:branched-chain amino acid transport system permease protein